MNLPFKIIESKITKRDEFEVVQGSQPTNALFYLKEGEFSIETDGKRQKLRAGDCMILPDYISFTRNVLEPIVFVYIKFSCESTFELPYGKIVFKDRKRFISSITMLESLLEKDSPFCVTYREHLLCDILLQAISENSGTESEPSADNLRDETVKIATEYIKENIRHKIRIEDICKRAGTNASTLNFKFRKYHGTSVCQYIISQRIRVSKLLLCGSTYSLTEIAQRSGFDNLYYFSNTFKKHLGVSPLSYRKSVQL